MDPRKILGVAPDASVEEIQRAYRDKVKKHHPDMGGDVWAFQQVNDAYQQLADQMDGKVNQNSKGSQRTRSPAPATSTTSSETARGSKGKSSSEANRRDWKLDWKKQLLLHRELPLQNETTFFIFINVMDIFMTYILLSFGAMEANPIANFFMAKWGFRGMIAFKLVNVLVVCLIAQFIAAKKPQTGRALLNVGSLIVGIVVIYSAVLFFRKFTIGA